MKQRIRRILTTAAVVTGVVAASAGPAAAKLTANHSEPLVR